MGGEEGSGGGEVVGGGGVRTLRPEQQGGGGESDEEEQLREVESEHSWACAYHRRMQLSEREEEGWSKTSGERDGGKGVLPVVTAAEQEQGLRDRVMVEQRGDDERRHLRGRRGREFRARGAGGPGVRERAGRARAWCSVQSVTSL